MGEVRRVRCVCGCLISKKHLNRHMKTQKHKNVLKLGYVPSKVWDNSLSRSENNKRIYAKGKALISKRNRRRYKKKKADTLNTQCQFIKTLFI